MAEVAVLSSTMPTARESGRARAAGPPEMDVATLERARQGDARARRKLVERHQAPVFALLSRILRGRDRAVVEDLAQETFLRVFVALPRFRPEGPARLSTWILRIASNLAIDELRRRRPEAGALDSTQLELAAGTRTDAEAERRSLAALLDRAVAELGPEFRAAFVLREYHQLDYAEIADALELDLGTVKSRLSRARARLRALLTEAHER